MPIPLSHNQLAYTARLLGEGAIRSGKPFLPLPAPGGGDPGAMGATASGHTMAPLSTFRDLGSWR